MNELSIHELTKVNLNEEQFYNFFLDYRFEHFYQSSLGIDNHAFTIFLIQKLKRRVWADNGCFWTINNAENKIIATFGLEKVKNSVKYYNKNIYTISSYYNFKKESKSAFILIKNVIEQYCKSNRIDYIKCKIDTSDHKNISFFQEESFRYYASSQKVYLKFETFNNSQKQVKGEYKVREFDEKTDMSACLKLISQHKLNEKYYNQEFSIEATQTIFEEWFKSQTKQKSSTTLVLYNTVKDNNIVGVSIHSRPNIVNFAFNKNLVTWDIAVLDKEERGQGLGNVLFSEIVAKEKADIEGSIMTDNLVLQKFLHKYNFFTVRTYVFLAKNITNDGVTVN